MAGAAPWGTGFDTRPPSLAESCKIGRLRAAQLGRGMFPGEDRKENMRDNAKTAFVAILLAVKTVLICYFIGGCHR